MPRYDVDPSQVSGVITVLDKGEYELLVGEPSAFEQEKKDADGKPTGEKSWGVRYGLTVMEGPEKGAKVIFTCYQHNEGGRSFSKAFQIAAAGFETDRHGEKAFDEKYRGSDWSFNSDTKGCGDAWRDLAGKRLTVIVDTKLGPDGITMQQQWKKFIPLNGAKK